MQALSYMESFIIVLQNTNYMVNGRWPRSGRKTTKLLYRDRRATWSEYKTCLFSLCFTLIIIPEEWDVSRGGANSADI